jgi:hypothetical protein
MPSSGKSSPVPVRTSWAGACSMKERLAGPRIHPSVDRCLCSRIWHASRGRGRVERRSSSCPTALRAPFVRRMRQQGQGCTRLRRRRHHQAVPRSRIDRRDHAAHRAGVPRGRCAPVRTARPRHRLARAVRSKLFAACHSHQVSGATLTPRRNRRLPCPGRLDAKIRRKRAPGARSKTIQSET